MKKQILLIVMSLFAMSVMAVNLPTTSYKSYKGLSVSEQPYTLGTGTTFINQSIVGSANYSHCNLDGGKEVGTCDPCCRQAICPENDSDCEDYDDLWAQYESCMGQCQGTHLGTLDTSVVFLLALIAAYGAVTVYRRKKATV